MESTDIKDISIVLYQLMLKGAFRTLSTFSLHQPHRLPQYLCKSPEFCQI